MKRTVSENSAVCEYLALALGVNQISMSPSCSLHGEVVDRKISSIMNRGDHFAKMAWKTSGNGSGPRTKSSRKEIVTQSAKSMCQLQVLSNIYIKTGLFLSVQQPAILISGCVDFNVDLTIFWDFHLSQFPCLGQEFHLQMARSRILPFSNDFCREFQQEGHWQTFPGSVFIFSRKLPAEHPGQRAGRRRQSVPVHPQHRRLLQLAVPTPRESHRPGLKTSPWPLSVWFD